VNYIHVSFHNTFIRGVHTGHEKDTSDFGSITNKKNLLLQDVLDIAQYNLVIYFVDNNFNTVSVIVYSGMITVFI